MAYVNEDLKQVRGEKSTEKKKKTHKPLNVELGNRELLLPFGCSSLTNEPYPST